MKLWGAVVGMLVGWVLGDFEAYGFVFGAILGLGLGAWLHGAIRGEVRRAVHDAVAPLGDEMRDAIPRKIVEFLDARPTPSAAVAQADAPTPVAREEVSPGPVDAVVLDNAPVHQPTRVEAEQQPVAPTEPSIAEHAFNAARDWLLGGNTIVRVGLVVLFVGLSFLARFAAAAGLFPIELRLSLVALAGVALLGVGFNRRLTRPAFGLSLQGAGVAVLYLTVFAAARFFYLLPPPAAFMVMVVICALGCALALLQDAKPLALAAFAGGYAVPFLLGGESVHPLIPFGYYTILNFAVLAIAWRRSWRTLNLLGFFATFAGATLWTLTSYRPEFYLVCQIFLAIAVLTYLATAVLYAHNTPGRLGSAADATLLFGPAVAGFGLEAGLVHDTPFASAWAALAFAAVYLAVAGWTLRERRTEMRVVRESLIAIGAGFVTLAVPLALEARWTSAAWALEGLGAVWVGTRQARWFPRAVGLALITVAALIVLATLEPNVSAVPLANSATIQIVIVALPLLAVAWLLRKPLPAGDHWLAQHWTHFEGSLGAPLFLAGFGLSILAIGMEASRAIPATTTDGYPAPVFEAHTRALLVAIGTLLAMLAAARLARVRGWEVAGWPAKASLPVVALTLAATVVMGRHVLEWPDLLFWLPAAGLHLLLLRRSDEFATGTSAHRWQHAMHAGTVWLAVALVADMLAFVIDRARLWDTSWSGVLYLVAGASVLLVLAKWTRTPAREPESARWPLSTHPRAWWWTGPVPLALLIFGGAVATALLAEGATAPLPYVALINPVDLAVVLAGVALFEWRRTVSLADIRPPSAAAIVGSPALVAGAALFFIALNGAWLRTAHHWLGVSWQADALAMSPAVQTGLAILWAATALALMLFARARSLRVVWLAGAALLGLTVAKLALVDLSSAESWQRIVTFIAVGVLMLLIGYFVPLPPREGDTPEGLAA